MIKNQFSILVLLVFVVQSCIYTKMDDSISLGSNYRYIQDSPQVIIYNTDPKHKGNGINIVPPIVEAYSFNERYIIAKSKRVNKMTGLVENMTLYWIIDKTKSNKSFNPMDSTEFYKTLNAENIGLNF